MQISGIDSVVYSIRDAFSQYGYNEYKMNKFEEYDLYVKNKDFLISKNVITFTDTNGKLLALKPDVTLSIVKNTKDGVGVKKVFYSENVYRVSSKSNGYKEIPQMGLECIGDLDSYNVAEVITLAKSSLDKISTANVLEISPVGIVLDYVNDLSLNDNVKEQVYKLIDDKNVHELSTILQENGVQKSDIELLTKVVNLYGPAKSILKELKQILLGKNQEKLVADFEEVLACLEESVLDGVTIDCSACQNVKYYNDITFRGYIENVPKAVLSGGRYDGLLKTMGKKSGAIGFAIYLDEFDRLFACKKEYDVDVLVLYNDKTDVKVVMKTVKELVSKGKTVRASKTILENVTFKEKLEI